jgi:hypothetical protein
MYSTQFLGYFHSIAEAPRRLVAGVAPATPVWQGTILLYFDSSQGLEAPRARQVELATIGKGCREFKACYSFGQAASGPVDPPALTRRASLSSG